MSSESRNIGTVVKINEDGTTHIEIKHPTQDLIDFLSDTERLVFSTGPNNTAMIFKIEDNICLGYN